MIDFSPSLAAWLGLGLAAWLLIWRVWLFRLVLKLGLKIALLLGPIFLVAALGIGLLGHAA